MDGLPPLPAPVPSPVLEGSKDELPPSLVPAPEEFLEDLSPLPVPVPEGCEDAPSPPADRLPVRRRPADRRIGRGRPPVQLPELWICRGPFHPPWSDVCFDFVLWASGIHPLREGLCHTCLCFEFLSLCFVILPGLVLCFLSPCTPRSHLFCVFP
ncbi:hypothetical protein AMECASPLE_025504 [Ameca splendens]|uniref:Uncharacterized protein n=1 Tax=Ameca splendens TaxID=208324 RepID=A0ABV0Y4J1_9TELE